MICGISHSSIVQMADSRESNQALTDNLYDKLTKFDINFHGSPLLLKLAASKTTGFVN